MPRPVQPIAGESAAANVPCNETNSIYRALHRMVFVAKTLETNEACISAAPVTNSKLGYEYVCTAYMYIHVFPIASF
jgi:hypothetical protein